jgi:hypothetical protein
MRSELLRFNGAVEHGLITVWCQSLVALPDIRRTRTSLFRQRVSGLIFLREGFQENFKAVHYLSGQFASTSLGENLVSGAVHLKEGV